MHLYTRNVNTAFRELVGIFVSGGESPRHSTHNVSVTKRPSRNGNVLMIDEPVTITYSHPRERVLFNAARDANPFFHLYEALYMLSGGNKIAPLAYYAKKMMDFSDDGVTQNGAYGYRWRYSYADTGYRQPGDEDSRDDPRTKVDQLDIIVNHLKADPNSRRAVLSMWNVEDDLLKIDSKTCPNCKGSAAVCIYPAADYSTCRYCEGGKQPSSKDVCCNLNVMFSLREIPWEYPSEAARKHSEEVTGVVPRRVLDMTVINRSNDLVWGLLGANYVHFTILQEYVAARLGVEVGRYHHFSNNLHTYDWNWKPEEWLDAEARSMGLPDYASPLNGSKVLFPLVKNPEAFERELPLFVETYSGEDPNRKTFTDYTEPFLRDVAEPALLAYTSYKRRHWDPDLAIALNTCSLIKADDWRVACTEWLKRRKK